MIFSCSKPSSKIQTPPPSHLKFQCDMPHSCLSNLCLLPSSPSFLISHHHCPFSAWTSQGLCLPWGDCTFWASPWDPLPYWSAPIFNVIPSNRTSVVILILTEQTIIWPIISISVLFISLVTLTAIGDFFVCFYCLFMLFVLNLFSSLDFKARTILRWVIIVSLVSSAPHVMS